MKQCEVVTGESYLFGRTDTKHKKDMTGTIVTVCGRKGGGLKYYENKNNGLPGFGRKMKRFKLTNGRYANASELRKIS